MLTKIMAKPDVVWVNGTFDVLHMGHIRLFEYAKSYGGATLRHKNYVCVGVDTDTRVKELKGESRPINRLSHRIEFLESIRFIDFYYNQTTSIIFYFITLSII